MDFEDRHLQYAIKPMSIVLHSNIQTIFSCMPFRSLGSLHLFPPPSKSIVSNKMPR